LACNRDIGALPVLNHCGLPTAPINEAQLGTAGELILPHFVDGAGFSTEFIFLNGSAISSSSSELMLYQDSGEEFPLSLR
jgi:hypothetical protein